MAEIMTPQITTPKSEGDINECAINWVLYLYSGHATKAGKQEHSDWLNQTQDHVNAYVRAEQWWRDMGYVEGDDLEQLDIDGASENLTALHAQGLQSERVGVDFGGRVRFFTGIAATLVFAVVAGLLYFSGISTQSQYSTAIAEVKVITLEDGSSVTLGGSTTIVASFSDDKRYVELAKGRAYFDVTSDPERPFTVQAGATGVRVVGTAFDVHKAVLATQVSVVKGIVNVAVVPDGAWEAEDVTPVELRAGDQVLAEHNNMLSDVRTFELYEVQGWRKGWLEYVDTRLSDVLEEVNRYRKNKITLSNEALGDIRLTMGMAADQTDNLLTGLEAGGLVRVERSGQAVRILPVINAENDM